MWEALSVHFPQSVSAPSILTRHPSHKMQPSSNSPLPLDTAGLVTMAANTQSFSLFLVHTCTCTFGCNVRGLSPSPWVFPGSAGEQSTCEQNPNAVPGDGDAPLHTDTFTWRRNPSKDIMPYCIFCKKIWCVCVCVWVWVCAHACMKAPSHK